MKSIARLKDQARLFESSEEWEKAIRTYEEILEVTESGGGEAELGLFNRVGDLHLRLGRHAEAVSCYERAADHYAEAGLYNNAIALCSKALRYLPQRVEIYRRLGQLSAFQGFLTDARRYFLEYAERKLRAGGLEDAFEALEEFASLSDDPEVRELLAQQLRAHGREAEAVDQLRRAYALRLHAGQAAEAEALREQIHELDPGAVLSLGETAVAGAAPDAEQIAGGGIELQSAAEMAGITAPAGPLPILEPLAGAEARDSAAPAPEAFEGLPPLDLEEGPAAGLGEGADVDLPALEGRDDPLPLLDGELFDPLAGDLADLPPEAEDPVPAEAGADFSLPLLDDSLSSLDGIGDTLEEMLPSLDDAGAALAAGTDPAVAPPLPLAGAEEASAVEAAGEASPRGAVGDDPEALLAGAEALLAAGRAEEAVDALERLLGTGPGAAALGRAAAILDELAAREPDDLRLQQTRVEYAMRRGDRAGKVRVFVDFADFLARGGEQEKSAAVYQRVLELDPSNPAARAALGAAAPRKPRYVDLAALLQDDDDDAGGSTRFVVEAMPPTGDEERDFAEMLKQFKAKLSEEMEATDSGSHYDLGLAFKDMGLIDEAISEFQLALRSSDERLKVYEELGQCFMLKGQYNVAAKLFNRALELPFEDETEQLGLNYHLGRCYEELGQGGNAREAYERVIAVDLGFRDTGARLARL